MPHLPSCVTQEGHRQSSYWGRGLTFQPISSTNLKQEPTIDCERFSMLFGYLSPWDFQEHATVIAKRAFRVSFTMRTFRPEENMLSMILE